MTPGRIVCAIGLAVCLSSLALAQSGSTARLVEAQGEVRVDDQPVATGSAPIVLGDDVTLRTGVGRAVVSFDRGAMLILAEGTIATIPATGGYTFSRIELAAGSAVVASGDTSPLVVCGTEVRLSSAGVFRFDKLAPEATDGSARCRFQVRKGAGATPGASLTYVLRAGERMILSRRAGDMIPVRAFSPADLDAFDQWSLDKLPPAVP